MRTPIPPMPPARIDLYSRRLRGAQVVAVCLLVLVMIIMGPLVFMLVGGLVTLASATAGVLAGLAAFLLSEFGMLVALLSLTRAAAWLDGSVLTVRGALSTRRCDLARFPDPALRWVSETVSMPVGNGVSTVVSTGRKFPVLTMRDERNKKMKLSLVDRKSGKPMDGPRIMALAGALQSGSQWPGRNGPAVQHTVATLHALAAEPDLKRWTAIANFRP